MGLLDALFSGSQGGYGGLLDSLMYQSPLTQKRDLITPSFGPNGEFDPSQFRSDPSAAFGPVPQYTPPAPPSPFNAGAAPLFGTPSQSQAPALPPPQIIAPPPQVAAPQGPINNMQIGGYQMPQFGNASDYTPQAPQTATAPQSPSSTDISAQSRQPPQELPPAFGGTSYLERLNNGGGLIGSMLGDTAQQKNLTAQYHAIRETLQANGDSAKDAASKAMIAVMNPEAAKTILPELFTSKEKYGVTSENPIEGKRYGFINERSQTINGKPIGDGGDNAQSIGMLAPGVKFDSNKTGEDYLNQFSPEVQAATKAWLKGDVLPSGNPRQNGIASVAKTVGQKYAADLGIPASDALYAEKRKYRMELGSNSANTAGGQSKAFNQGISHLTSLADTLEKLDNSNGLGVPVIAQGVNAVRQGMSNNQAAIADEARSIGQTVAGEVGKLFSGSAGGGVHERELTRERFDTAKSKPQLAAALRATVETMQGGLTALEANRDRILGQNSGVDLVSAETRQNITKIQGAIDRLEGKSSGRQTKTGVTWSVVK